MLGWLQCLIWHQQTKSQLVYPSYLLQLPFVSWERQRVTHPHLEGWSLPWPLVYGLLQGFNATYGVFFTIGNVIYVNTSHYYPTWGILVHFHRDHPWLLVTVLGWGELKFFYFIINNVLGCGGGFKAVAVCEVTLLLHKSKSSSYKMGVIIEILG